LAFNVPNPEKKNQVDHIDSNGRNNKLENLKWSTQKEQTANINTKKKMINANTNSNRGYKIKLTYPDNKEEIFTSLGSLSNKIGICSATIINHMKKNMEYRGYKFYFIE